MEQDYMLKIRSLYNSFSKAKNGMWIAEANSEKKTKQNETNTGLQGIQWKRRAGTNEK